MMTPALQRDSEMRRVFDHGTAAVDELERALNWTPERGCPISGDALMILKRKGFFR